jgi:enoyl-[acyl-carrier-protein] reductase (NADH)
VTVKGSRLAALRILIVEDNFSIAAGIARLIKAQGAEVAALSPPSRTRWR